MTSGTLHILTRLHGLCSWLTVLLLVVSSARCRRIPSPIPASLYLTAIAATVMTSLSAAIGFALHLPYQYRLRQRIFIESEALGRLFERKEHLAFFALLFSWCALFALIALSLRNRARAISLNPADLTQNDAVSSDLKRAVFLAFTASAITAALASIAASIVTRRFHLTFIDPQQFYQTLLTINQHILKVKLQYCA